MNGRVWGAWDDATRDDPFPMFAEALRRCPVLHVQLADGHEAWLVLGHDAARAALGDARLSKNMVAALEQNPEVVAEGLPGPEFAHHMLAMDAPDHGRLRSLVAEAFRPSRVAALRPAIEHLADRLLDAMAAEGCDAIVDLRTGFAHPLPFAVICELLGVNDDDRRTLHDAFATLLRPWPSPPPPEAVAASDIVTGTLRALVADAQPDPEGGLVAVLVDAVRCGEATEAEALSSLFQLVVAGHDTTSSLIGNGVVALLDHPDQMSMLQREPELLAPAIEELLRFTAAVPHATFRVTTEPVRLGDVTIPAGQQVLVGLGAANRDPSVFADPDHLDVARRDRRHLAFGHGPHHCLGAPLARLEAEIAFRRLLKRFPDIRLAVPRDQLAWSHGDGLVLRGLAELPVLLGPDGGRSQATTQPRGATTMTTTNTDRPVDNGVNVEALLGARDALSQAPAAAEFIWKATCTWQRGTHSRSTVDSFTGLGTEHRHTNTYTFDVDHPECFASADNGATPVEYVLVGLVGCLTAGIASVAQHRGIQLRAITATVEGEMNVLGILGADPDVRNGFNRITARFAIDADASREDLQALLAQSQKRSAVFDVVTNPTDVVVELV
jgi:cytochrome P450/uncharacterized OsmC-like protein